jgi:hypothetical protein
VDNAEGFIRLGQLRIQVQGPFEGIAS